MYEISKEDVTKILSVIGNSLTWFQSNEAMVILQTLKEVKTETSNLKIVEKEIQKTT